MKDALKLIANLDGVGFRTDKLKGRECYVASVVMLTVGVHNGSAGALLYEEDELRKFPESWNGRPVVVYHPAGITANEKGVIESSVIGQLLNTRFYDNKLVSEAWIYKDDVQNIDTRIEKALLENKIMEVSTGLFAEFVPEKGIWNGEEFTARAVAYRPDHLAILPDQIGACSINDGAGLLRNKELESAEAENNKSTKGATMERKSEIQDLIENSKFEESDAEFLEALSDEQFGRVVNAVVTEEKVEETEEPVEEPVENAEPVEKDWLAEAPEEYREIIENHRAKLAEEKKAVVDGILENAACEFSAEELDAFDADTLGKIAKLAEKPEPEVIENKEEESPVVYAGQGGEVEPVENKVEVTPLGLPNSHK